MPADESCPGRTPAQCSRGAVRPLVATVTRPPRRHPVTTACCCLCSAVAVAAADASETARRKDSCEQVWAV